MQDPSTALRMTMLRTLSLYSVEGFLEDFEIAGIASLLSRCFDPLFLEGILRRAIRLVKHSEDAGERKRGEFVRGELVGDVVAHFVLGCAVPFLFLDHFETAALAWVGWIEDVREKLDAFAQTFDDTEALVIEGALDHLHHVSDVRGVGPRDERGTGRNQFFHRIHRLIDRAGGIGFALESQWRGRRGLFLRQAIDEVVHDEIRHVDVLARAVIEMIATNRKAVAVAAEQKHVEIGPGEADTAGKRDRATVNEVCTVTIDEIRKARRTTDPCKRDNLFVLEISFFQKFVERGEHGEIAAARTPRRVIGGDCFFG